LVLEPAAAGIDPAEAWHSLARGEWVVMEHSTTAPERTIIASPTTNASRALALDDLRVFGCPTSFSALPACLTRAEQAIVLEFVAGSSQRVIAGARGTSMRTVANQVASIFRKLNVRSRIEPFAALACR
jgi:DNA-binding NarL/FixJ family response regulator